MLRQSEQMRTQFSEPHLLPDGDAVVDDMKIRGPEIDQTVAPGVLDIGIADVPLLGNDPIEDLRAAGDLVERQGNELL